ncbi:hypothetical protein AAG906_029814 [Vitis piasezkii]
MSEVFSAREWWNLAPWAAGGDATGFELAIVPFGLGLESPLAEMMTLHLEEGKREEGWSSNCLAKFSRCLGMPTEGFEEEILYLLRRMERRIEQKSEEGACLEGLLDRGANEDKDFIMEWQLALGGQLEMFWDNKLVELLEVEERIRDREVFWEKLESIKGLWRDPWCMRRDFNMVRYLEKHSRRGGLSTSMRRFTEVVEDLELRDYPLQGGRLPGEVG